MKLPITRSVAQRLKFPDQLLVSAKSVIGRDTLERESRRLKTNDGRIVTFQVFEDPCSEVLCLANVDPKSIKETVDAGALGRILQDRFALKQIPAVTSFGERHAGSSLFSVLFISSRFGNSRFGLERRRSHWITTLLIESGFARLSKLVQSCSASRHASSASSVATISPICEPPYAMLT